MQQSHIAMSSKASLLEQEWQDMIDAMGAANPYWIEAMDGLCARGLATI